MSTMIPIIDTHQHLWDLSKFQLPWLADAPHLQRSFLPEDYVAATADAHVVKAVYMEVDVDPAQQVQEAENIIAICAQEDTPTVAAVISGRPAAIGFQAYVDRFKDSVHIKGIRQVLHVPDVPAGYCLQPDFVRGVQYLGKVGLYFDICMRPRELGDGAELAKRCPDTQFILDHCGNAIPDIVRMDGEPPPSSDPFAHGRQQWRDDISAMAEHPNVVCKISGIVARAGEHWQPEDLAPTINHCLDAFGPDRVIFGGDWPVCTARATFQEWTSALRAIIAPRSTEEQRKLLHDNAAALYGLASR